MNTIKQIFDEIAAESGTNKKMEILGKYKDNKVLEKVLYMANSKRVKFYLKQIPEYKGPSYICASSSYLLEEALTDLEMISRREVTGHDAVKHLKDILSRLTVDGDAYIIERIIEKDCKIGMGTTNINKIFPKLLEKTPYMGAKPFEEALVKKMFEGDLKPFQNGKAYSQVKMDGRYCNAIIRHGEVELESRQGEPTILTGAKFITELSKQHNCVLNGELTMEGVSRYESNGIIASLIDIISKREERSDKENAKKLEAFEKKHMPLQEALDKVIFTIWDMISIEEYFENKSSRPYYIRFDNVIEMITLPYANDGVPYTNIKFIETAAVNTYEGAIQHFKDVLNRGEEGTILKSYDGHWKDGKPNWQVKMKLEMDVDLKIVGFNKGTGKNADVYSSLNAESEDGKVFTRPTGINEAMMAYITENEHSLMGKIIEVKCCGLSKDVNGNYALLHPVFKGIRDDKDVADTLEQIIAIENMAKGLQ